MEIALYFHYVNYICFDVLCSASLRQSDCAIYILQVSVNCSDSPSDAHWEARYKHTPLKVWFFFPLWAGGDECVVHSEEPVWRVQAWGMGELEEEDKWN